MNSRWHVIFILLLLTGATGCSRFRELTRRDYALLRDPFVNRFSDDDNVADTAARIDDDDPAGRVSMDDTATAAAHYGVTGKSKTVNTVSGTSAPAGRLSEIQIQGLRNDVAQSSGPSLSDFIDMEPEQPRMPMPPLPKQPDIRKNANGFGVFAEKRTAATEGTVTPTDVKNDFADWASLQHKKWNSDARPPTSHTPPGQIRQVSQTVKTAADDDGLPTLPSPDIAGIETEVPDTATPLIRQTALNTASRSQVMTTTPPIGSQTPFAGATSGRNARTPSQSPIQPPTFDLSASNENKLSRQPPPPVFDSPAQRAETTPDPFAEYDNSQNPARTPFAVNAAQRNAAASGPVDSTFHFDTGWKPSNLTRP
jgi:hypothetical protein